MTKTSIFIGFLFFTSNLWAQNPSAYIADSLQKILDASLPLWATNPGVVARIDVPGKWSWSGSSGYAISGTTAGFPATPANDTNVFRLGSISKVFTTIAILKLEEAGLLNTDDDIALYLRPSLLNDTIQNSSTVYIRNLLNHTSGIANSANNNVCRINALNDPTRFFSLEELIFCGADLGEEFAPGSSWEYSNTNYSILAMIIENVSGIAYNDYITDSILVPAGLNRIFIPDNDTLLLGHSGCYYNFGAPIGLRDLTIVDESLYRGWANMVGNVEEINLFYQMLRNGQIISAASLAKMFAILPQAEDYGFGIEYWNVVTGLEDYFGHSGDVGTTNGMFFCDISTPEIPDGYYISYNYNYSGVSSRLFWDIPVRNLLSNYTTAIETTKQNASSLSIFPNPAHNTLHINNQSNQPQQILVYNSLGQKMAEMLIPAGISSLDLQHYPQGIYFLKNEQEATALRWLKY